MCLCVSLCVRVSVADVYSADLTPNFPQTLFHSKDKYGPLQNRIKPDIDEV